MTGEDLDESTHSPQSTVHSPPSPPVPLRLQMQERTVAGV